MFQGNRRLIKSKHPVSVILVKADNFETTPAPVGHGTQILLHHLEKGQVRFEGSAQELAERDDLARAVFLGKEGG